MSKTVPANTPGRKAVPAAQIEGPQFVGKTPDDITVAEVLMHQHDAQVQALATSLGYVGSLDSESLWSMVEYRQRRSVEDILEMGRGLLLIKEQTPHGEFEGQAQARGIHPRVARRLMAVALKFTKTDSKSVLKAAGIQTKMLELTVLEDEELAALESGESVSGINLDDVERMSASELRRALRESRADAEAKDQRINKLSDDLNKEHEKTAKAQRRWKAADPDQQLVILKQSVTEAEQNVLAALGSDEVGLRGAFRALVAHASGNDQDNEAAIFLADVIGRLLTMVRLVRDDEELPISIPVVNDGMAG